MLTLNGKKFVETDKEAINTLFETGGTFTGYYKRTKTGILLYNHKKQRIGGINLNHVLYRTTKRADGKYWHSYGDVDGIGRYDSYTRQYNEVREALEQ